MATQKVLIDNNSVVLKDVIGEGGQARVYKYGQDAVKIYFDESQCLPSLKIQELSRIGGNVIAPRKQVLSNKGNLCGYTMPYVKDADPLCALFPKAYKDKYALDISHLTRYYQNLLTEVQNVHKSNCLVVDLNEMNVLFKKQGDIYIIDCDSFQTPSFPATAIMESIRDPKSPPFSKDSDFYSFAILAFQIFINIHPYKGSHPKYKAGQWKERMRDGVSAFNPDAKLPPVCADLNGLPPILRDYFFQTFEKGLRDLPPFNLDAKQQPMARPTVVLGNAGFEIKPIWTLDNKIRRFHFDNGDAYAVTNNKVYRNGKEIYEGNVTIAVNSDFFVHQKKDHFVVSDLAKNIIDPSVKCTGEPFVKNGRLYFVQNADLMEGRIENINANKCFLYQRVESLNKDSSGVQVFDGVVIQNIFGRKWANIPYAPRYCSSLPLTELQEYRIIDAKSERNVLIVIGEKAGKYHRFIFLFNKNFNSYEVHETNDVDYNGINFTVLDNGITVMVGNDSKIVVFKNLSNLMVVDNCPINESNYLANNGAQCHFVEDNKIYTISLKK